jgi:WD40 repeat protein
MLVSVFLLIAVGAGFVAYEKEQEANQQKEVAIKAKVETQEALVESNNNYALALNEKALNNVKKRGVEEAKLLSLMSLSKSDFSQNLVDSIKVFSKYGVQSNSIFRTENNAHHDWDISSVDFSNNGEMVASGSWDKTVKVWDVLTGEYKRYDGHKSRVTSVRFSPDNKKLISSDSDGVLILWDLGSSELITLKDPKANTGPKFSPMKVITSLQFSSDNSKVIYGSWDKTVRLWDLKAGQSQVLYEHDGLVTDVSFSSTGDKVFSITSRELIVFELYSGKQLKFTDFGLEDGVYLSSFALSIDEKKVILGMDDGRIIEFEILSGNVKSYPGHTDSITDLIYIENDTKIISSSLDKKIQVLTLSTRKIKTLEGHSGPVESIALSSDEKKLISGGGDNKLIIWDLEKGLSEINLFSDAIREVIFTNDGKFLVSRSDDQSIVVFDVKSGENKKLVGHGRASTSIAVSKNSKMIVSGFSDRLIIWNLVTGKQEGSIDSLNEVTQVMFGQNEDTIIFSTRDKKIEVWNWKTGRAIFKGVFESRILHMVKAREAILLILRNKELWFLDPKSAFKKKIPFIDSRITSWDYFVDSGKTAFTVADDNSFFINDPKSGELKEFIGHLANINSLKFSLDGSKVITSSEDSTIRLWDIETGVSKVFSGHASGVHSAVLSPDGRIIASGSDDNTVRFWDVGKEGSESLKAHESVVNSLALSPNGELVASASFDGTITVWDTKTGQYIKKANSRSVEDLVFTSNGFSILSGSYDNNLNLWNIRTNEVKTLSGHKKWVNSVALSESNELLVSGSSDNNVRIWAATSKDSKVLTGHQNPVTSVAFLSKKNHIVSSSRDGTIRLWDLDTKTNKVLIQSRVPIEIMKVLHKKDKLIYATEHEVIVFDLEKLTSQKLTTEKGLIYDFDISSDGKRLAITLGKSFKLIDINSGKTWVVRLNESINDEEKISSLIFSKNNKDLVVGTTNGLIKIFNIDLLSRPKSYWLNLVGKFEAQSGTYIKGVSIISNSEDPNLYGRNYSSPIWPKNHPFHWQEKAEQGDSEALLQLGIIAQRDKKWDKAKAYYQKAKTAGHKNADYRLKINELMRKEYSKEPVH